MVRNKCFAALICFIVSGAAHADLTPIDTAAAGTSAQPPHFMTPTPATGPSILKVGPTRELKLPSQAAAIAKTGDIIEIDSGLYRGDVASWRADNLTIRGVGGRARLFAAGRSAEDKAIWVIKGRNAIVENIEFAEAAVPAGNGAGIRAEGANLKVSNCYFHDNQEGILSSIYTTESTIDIENSEFARDGGNNGQSHEIYISNLRELIVRGSYFHEGRIGHLIKSRAQKNTIVANRITDEANGTASYEIEFPFGGLNIVAGNLIEQGPGTQNSTILANALEGASNSVQELYVVNNTFVNDLGRGVFIRSRQPSTATIINNIFVGGGVILMGEGKLENNLLSAGPGGAPVVEQPIFGGGAIAESGTKTAQDPGLADIGNYDYRLRAGSPAIGRGIDPGSAGSVILMPMLEYVHPAGSKPITTQGPIDIGAYQYSGQ